MALYRVRFNRVFRGAVFFGVVGPEMSAIKTHRIQPEEVFRNH